jgi:hypothetical protein
MCVSLGFNNPHQGAHLDLMEKLQSIGRPSERAWMMLATFNDLMAAAKDRGRALRAKARWIAANIAKLPELV